MDQNCKACAECARVCSLIHRGKNDSHAVTSFFKVMIGDSFSQTLFLPPKFAHSVSSRAGQNAILEDSSGQIWEVTFQNLNGSIIFQQGWSTFASDHDLGVGDFVLFFLIRESHFVVKIYDRTSCEKSFSDRDDERIRKSVRERTKRKDRPWDTTYDKSGDKCSFSDPNEANGVTNDDTATEPKEEYVEEMSYMIGRDSDGKQEEDRLCNFDLSVFEARNVSESRIPHFELSCNFQNDARMVSGNEVAKGSASEVLPSRLISDNNGSYSLAGTSAPLATTIVNPRENGETLPNNAKKESHISEGNGHMFLSPKQNLDTGNQQSTKKEIHGISGTSNIPTTIAPENCQSGDNQATLSRGSEQSTGKEFNGVSMTFNTAKLVKKKSIPEQSMKEIIAESAKIKTDPCNKEAPRKHHAIKMEITEDKRVKTEFYSHCHNTIPNLCGESLKANKSDFQQRVNTMVQEHKKTCPVVVKTEIIDSDDDTVMINPIKSSPMLVTCSGQSYIELPETLPFPIIKGKANRRKMVYLRDSTMNAFPVMYHQKLTTQFLSTGWEELSRANYIKSGDQCLFTVENEADGIYSFRVV